MTSSMLIFHNQPENDRTMSCNAQKRLTKRFGNAATVILLLLKGTLIYTYVTNRETILDSRKERQNMYYRVAIQMDASSTWQWKSTTLSSLDPLFQFLRRYRNLQQDHLRVFSSSSREELGEQLMRENNGLGSHSVTAAQFLQERMIGSQQGTSTAVSNRPSINKSSRGTEAQDKREVSSLERRQVGRERGAGRGDFWNIMTLVEA